MQQKDKRVPPSVSVYAEQHGLFKIEIKFTDRLQYINIFKNLYLLLLNKI